MNETTPAMKSKTVTLNAAAVAALQLAQVFGWDPAPETATAVMSLIPFANILLRMVTKTPLG